jgi:hypothetical protein
VPMSFTSRIVARPRHDEHDARPRRSAAVVLAAQRAPCKTFPGRCRTEVR